MAVIAATALVAGVAFTRWFAGRCPPLRSLTDRQQVARLIEETCVDSSGALDEAIQTGWWRPAEVELDLNGDGRTERIVLFYSWQKWSANPQEAAVKFNESYSIDQSCTVNAVLILGKEDSCWKALGYTFADYDGFSLSVETDPRSGLRRLVGHDENAHLCFVWGVTTPGGMITSLSNVPTRFGNSGPIPRFSIRTQYPK